MKPEMYPGYPAVSVNVSQTAFAGINVRDCYKGLLALFQLSATAGRFKGATIIKPPSFCCPHRTLLELQHILQSLLFPSTRIHYIYYSNILFLQGHSTLNQQEWRKPYSSIKIQSLPLSSDLLLRFSKVPSGSLVVCCYQFCY